MYEVSITIIISHSIRVTTKRILKKHNIKSKLPSGFSGMTVNVGFNKYYIILKSSPDYNTILHEIYHVVRMITDDRLIKEEESIAWVQGYIGEKIFKFLIDKGIKINLS